jgi:hypothetical protein
MALPGEYPLLSPGEINCSTHSWIRKFHFTFPLLKNPHFKKSTILFSSFFKHLPQHILSLHFHLHYIYSDFLSDTTYPLHLLFNQKITPLFHFLLLHDSGPKQTNTNLIFPMQKQKKSSHFIAGRSRKRKKEK